MKAETKSKTKSKTKAKAQNDSVDFRRVGIYPDSSGRSGTYICHDDKYICAETAVDSMELLPIAEALEKYPDVRKKYFWKHVEREGNKVAEQCANTSAGFFLRVKKGSKIKLPCQAALYLTNSADSQFIHNVIVVEENAEVELITGCISEARKLTGIHAAVTEIFIKKNAVLNNIMVHSWSKSVEVYPHTVAYVEANGRMTNNYISLQSPAKTVSNPVTILQGDNAKAKLQSVILGSKGSAITVGGMVYLRGRNTGAELLHRAVSTGGTIIQQGFLIGENKCRAHIDCAGMVLSAEEKSLITSVPGLKSSCPDAQMSHEASLGKIIPEQVEYLMAHGIVEKEAISMIIRGFLDIDIKGLGSELDARITEVAELAGHYE